MSEIEHLYTTGELFRRYGINPRTARKYAPDLQDQDLAFRTGDTRGRGGNPWMFREEAIPLLLKHTRPDRRRKMDDRQRDKLVWAWERTGNTNQVAKFMGVSWWMAHRWLVREGLK